MMSFSIGIISPVEGIIAALGIGHIAVGLSQKWSAEDSQTWLGTEGTIRDCKTWQNNSDNDTSYACGVQYEYTVDGRTYQSSRLQFGKGDYLDRRKRC